MLLILSINLVTAQPANGNVGGRDRLSGRSRSRAACQLQAFSAPHSGTRTRLKSSEHRQPQRPPAGDGAEGLWECANHTLTVRVCAVNETKPGERLAMARSTPARAARCGRSMQRGVAAKFQEVCNEMGQQSRQPSDPHKKGLPRSRASLRLAVDLLEALHRLEHRIAVAKGAGAHKALACRPGGAGRRRGQQSHTPAQAHNKARHSRRRLPCAPSARHRPCGAALPCLRGQSRCRAWSRCRTSPGSPQTRPTTSGLHRGGVTAQHGSVNAMPCHACLLPPNSRGMCCTQLALLPFAQPLVHASSAPARPPGRLAAPPPPSTHPGSPPRRRARSRRRTP